MATSALRAVHQQESPNKRVLHDFGYFGHYLWLHRGGRGGRQRVLKTVLAHGGQMSQAELLESSAITSASLSEVVSKLEREELLIRTRSEVDRRQVLLTLTPCGMEKAAEVVRGREQFEKDALSCLSEAEIHELLSMLDRIVDHWKVLETLEKEGDACKRN